MTNSRQDVAESHGFAPQETLSNGIDALAEMLQASLRADVCLMVLVDAHASEPRLHRAAAVYLRTDGVSAMSGLGARPLIRASDGPLVFSRPRGRAKSCGNRHRESGHGSAEACGRLTKLADILEVNSVLSVPLGSGDSCIGRVYIGSRQQRYTHRDLVPLSQGAKHARILIESVLLADRLAREVASQERRRISRDLHDSAIQPYIGLKLGLEAMRRRLRGSADLVGDLDELIKIARDGIGELRDYLGSLKKAEARKQVTSLLAAVRVQAKKFAEFYGIDAKVIANGDISVSTPLRQEVMHIVREGLSNVRRHTCAERATINLREAHGQLLVEVINDKARQASKRGFFPRSISERAKALGGRVSVRRRSGQRTVVAVELPLQGTAP
jgi:signal transduction histidine kinase